MRVAIGADHAGLTLKEAVKAHLEEEGVSVDDRGTHSGDSVDYPDFAEEVAQAVVSGRADRGILICGTGLGMSITANKIPGIRAAHCHDVFSARATREDNDANVLTMGGRVIGSELAKVVVDAFLAAEFAGGRHQRRVDKIGAIEERRHED